MYGNSPGPTLSTPDARPYCTGASRLRHPGHVNKGMKTLEGFAEVNIVKSLIQCEICGVALHRSKWNGSQYYVMSNLMMIVIF